MARRQRPLDGLSSEWVNTHSWIDSSTAQKPGRKANSGIRSHQFAEDTFAFVTLSVALLAPVIGSLTPVLALLLLIVAVSFRRAFVVRTVMSNWTVALLPLFAIASTLWSINPPVSAYYATQYLMTALLGLLIGSSTSRRQGFSGVFYAFAVFCVGSAIFGRSVGWGDGGPGGTAFAGVVASKNSAGDIAAIGAMASLSYFLQQLVKREFLGALTAAMVLLVQVYLTLASQSSGAVLGLGIGCGFIACASVACALPSQYRVLLAIGLVLGLLGIAATSEMWFQPLLDSITAAFGKSPTLTGRAAIWEDAGRLMRERPSFGLGFSAFWVHGNLDAEGIWRTMGIANRTGFNFHNTAFEILVHLGWVGFVLFAVVFCVRTLKLWAKTTYQPDIAMIFWSAFIVYQLSRMYAEARGMKLFDYGTIMLFAAMAMGGSAVRTPISVRHQRPPAHKL